jgi:peptidoglycan/LPS O-acetylase OafA/YrhL
MAPSDSDHLDYLDGWRGLAISLLLIGHFLPVPGINFGRVGVDLFFVLSGWLMTRLLFIQHTPIDTFYRRRISRILPAHLFFVVLISACWALFAGKFSSSEALAAALFVNNYVGSEAGASVLPVGHIWSLSVEEHSYVLLSLLAVAARKGLVDGTLGIGAVALACAACAVGYGVFAASPKLYFEQWLHTEVAGYGIFVSGFILLLLRRVGPRRWPAATVPLLALCGVMLQWWSVPLAVQKVVGVGALALAVNLLPQAPALLRATLAWKPLRTLGLWSFSLYIWQQPFYLWAGGGSVPTGVRLLLAFAAGLASFYLLEQPARRYLNRTWGRAPAPLATQQP